MIRKLRIQLIIMIAGSLLIVFAVMFVTLNVYMYLDSESRSDGFLRMVADNDGTSQPSRRNTAPPQRFLADQPPVNSEMVPQGGFFYVKINDEGVPFEINLDMIFDFSESDANECLEIALERDQSSGKIGNISYLIAQKAYGKIIVFLERDIEDGILNQLRMISLWSMAIAALIVTTLSVIFSKWATNPVKSAFEKQRRFISDASHELKTPLTIISANADVLKNEIGENERVSHIQTQTGRMTLLIHELLTLAKTDEEKRLLVKDEFALSKAVLNTVLEFESRVFEEGKEYTYDVKPSLLYKGDERQIKQLLSILIDNAIRHSDKNGKIRVSLSDDTGQTRLSVFNTGVGIPDSEKDKIFDRFYRSDDSRSRETGGYGLGLAIAKSIADAHKARLSVTGEYKKWVEFTVLL